MTERPSDRPASPIRPEASFAIHSDGNQQKSFFQVMHVLEDPDAERAGITTDEIELSGLTMKERDEIKRFAREMIEKGFDALNLYHLVDSKVRELIRAKGPIEFPGATIMRGVERRRLKEFFDVDFEVPPLPKGVTPEKMLKWAEMDFGLRYLPRIEMTPDRDFPGWKHKPRKYYKQDVEFGIEFYDDIQYIKSLPENASNPNLKGLSPVDLPGCWVLADTRKKPTYDDGEQVYENDEAIKNVIEQLIKDGVVSKDDYDLGPRNNIYPSFFQKPEFWSAFKRALQLEDVPGAVVRLPRVIEANVMGQRAGFHDTDTYEWCEEYYGAGNQRLMSGNSDHGGASNVEWMDVGNDFISFRPLVVFPRE